MSPEELLDDEICPSVTVKLGKKEYRLAFTMCAVLAFKKATGRNIFVEIGWEGFNLRDDPDSILAFFWAALQTYHPEITLEKAGKMVHFGNMTLVANRCHDALRVFMPEAGVDPDPKQEPTTAQLTGSGIGA
jgi:hypothetical protein